MLKKHMDFASQNKEEYMETLKGLPVANAINEKIIEEKKRRKKKIIHLQKSYTTVSLSAKRI